MAGWHHQLDGCESEWTLGVGDGQGGLALPYPFRSCWTFRLIPCPAAAKSLQSCLILCNPIDGSPPGSPVSGILQARILEWVPISFSNAWKWKVKVNSLSPVWLFLSPWTVIYQAPASMGFSRQEYWSGLPFPSPDFMQWFWSLRKWSLSLFPLFPHLFAM